MSRSRFSRGRAVSNGAPAARVLALGLPFLWFPLAFLFVWTLACACGSGHPSHSTHHRSTFHHHSPFHHHPFRH